MTRRQFAEILGGITMSSASAAAEPRTRFYLMQTFYLRHGTQLQRLHDYLEGTLIPEMSRKHQGSKIALEAIVAAHLPQVVFVSGHSSLEDLRAQQAEMCSAGFQAWEQGEEAPYEKYSMTLLEATPYSPEVVIPSAAPAAKRRIFELRVYHSPTWRQLAALHDRFAGPEIKIFHRVGIHPILYTQTLMGSDMPNLTYLIPFENLAAREKAWDAFASDPEWIKVRQESIERYGQIASINQISLFRATAYSPVQ
jgi:NIPSNAP.